MRDAFTNAARALVRRTGYAVVWRNPRGYSLPTHLLAVFDRLDVNCVLDVGAHFGEYATTLRRYGYRGRIVSFEPVPENFGRLEAAMRGDRDWRGVCAALGSRDEPAEINVARDTALSSFLMPTADPLTPALAVEERRTVDVRTLDAVFDDCVAGISEPRVFLKMDTQGWDREVLAGAGRSLARVLGVQSEVSVQPLYAGMQGYLEAIGELETLGYELTGVYPVAHDDHLRLVELDVVLVRFGA